MRMTPWFRMGVALALLSLTAGGALAEQAPGSQSAQELGGGRYTFQSWWTESPRANETDFSGTLFEPVEKTARGVYEVNEGLLGPDNFLFPTWEEIKKEGALKKTFHF